MIWPLVLLLSIQALYAAEFPDLVQNIKVIWENVDITNTLDGSQTVSTNGTVTFFTLCGLFNNTNSNDGNCDFDYSYKAHLHDSIAQGSGNGTDSPATFHSKINETYSCVNFYAYLPSFSEVYDSAEEGTGFWKVEYNCKVVTPFPTAIVVGVLVGALLVIGGIFGYKYFQKKKNTQTNDEGSYMATP